MNKILTIIIIVILVGIAYIFLNSNVDTKSTTNIAVEENISEPVFNKNIHIVAEDETFADIMEDFGFSYMDMLTIVDIASSTYDFTRVKIGQPISLVTDEVGKKLYIEYEKNKDSYVRVNFIGNNFEVLEGDIAYDVEIVRQQASIETSMYIDALAVNVPEEIIMQFADIFAWTIDFAVQVQSGDSFDVVYEKRSRDGKDAGVGNVLAGKFVNNGKEYSAYLFEDDDAKLAYYSATGESTQKEFLRAPLNYRRITSGFTYGRFHPVIGGNYDHLAIDYAATIGTPVMAVGDGVISFAGWHKSGFGNFIDIRHNEMYQTQYAHLNGFAKGIRAGMQVKQGQIIGYVGSTGYSTGAHLHYQIKYYGKLVNPLTIELPPGDPVSEEKRDIFEKRKIELEKYFQ